MYDPSMTTASNGPSNEVELLDLSDFAALLRERRGSLALRKGAEDAGVSFSTLSRAERGHQPDLASFTKLCAWLGQPPSRFFTTGAPVDDGEISEAIKHLRRDPRLTPAAAESIASVMRQMYESLARSMPERPTVACHLRAAGVLRPGAPERLASLLSDLQEELERRATGGTL